MDLLRVHFDGGYGGRSYVPQPRRGRVCQGLLRRHRQRHQPKRPRDAAAAGVRARGVRGLVVPRYHARLHEEGRLGQPGQIPRGLRLRRRGRGPPVPLHAGLRAGGDRSRLPRVGCHTRPDCWDVCPPRQRHDPLDGGIRGHGGPAALHYGPPPQHLGRHLVRLDLPRVQAHLLPLPAARPVHHPAPSAGHHRHVRHLRVLGHQAPGVAPALLRQPVPNSLHLPVHRLRVQPRHGRDALGRNVRQRRGGGREDWPRPREAQSAAQEVQHADDGCGRPAVDGPLPPPRLEQDQRVVRAGLRAEPRLHALVRLAYQGAHRGLTPAPPPPSSHPSLLPPLSPSPSVPSTLTLTLPPLPAPLRRWPATASPFAR